MTGVVTAMNERGSYSVKEYHANSPLSVAGNSRTAVKALTKRTYWRGEIA